MFHVDVYIYQYNIVYYVTVKLKYQLLLMTFSSGNSHEFMTIRSFLISVHAGYHVRLRLIINKY